MLLLPRFVSFIISCCGGVDGVDTSPDENKKEKTKIFINQKGIGAWQQLLIDADAITKTKNQKGQNVNGRIGKKEKNDDDDDDDDQRRDLNQLINDKIYTYAVATTILIFFRLFRNIRQFRWSFVRL